VEPTPDSFFLVYVIGLKEGNEVFLPDVPVLATQKKQKNSKRADHLRAVRL
jgi:hypothetical protein